MSEQSKQLLRDAVVYFEYRLAEEGLIAATPSSTVSHEALLIGDKIFASTVEMLTEYKLIEDDELISFDEADEENRYWL